MSGPFILDLYISILLTLWFGFDIYNMVKQKKKVTRKRESKKVNDNVYAIKRNGGK